MLNYIKELVQDQMPYATGLVKPYYEEMTNSFGEEAFQDFTDDDIISDFETYVETVAPKLLDNPEYYPLDESKKKKRVGAHKAYKMREEENDFDWALKVEKKALAKKFPNLTDDDITVKAAAKIAKLNNIRRKDVLATVKPTGKTKGSKTWDEEGNVSIREAFLNRKYGRKLSEEIFKDDDVTILVKDTDGRYTELRSTDDHKTILKASNDKRMSILTFEDKDEAKKVLNSDNFQARFGKNNPIICSGKRANELLKA